MQYSCIYIRRLPDALSCVMGTRIRVEEGIVGTSICLSYYDDLCAVIKLLPSLFLSISRRLRYIACTKHIFRFASFIINMKHTVFGLALKIYFDARLCRRRLFDVATKNHHQTNPERESFVISAIWMNQHGIRASNRSECAPGRVRTGIK